MKNRSYWFSAFIAFLLFTGMFAVTGCRVFDFFTKDSSPSNGSASYVPPATPETLEQERPVVKARINELIQALETKSINRVVELCDNQEGYREILENDLQNLPEVAKALKNAELTMVGPGYSSYGIRCGEVNVNNGSQSYTITMIKRNGKWFFQDL